MGRKTIVFTPEQIDQVGKLAAVLTREQMAHFFGISEKTFDNLRERQPEIDTAYKRARAETIGEVAQSLVQDALDGDTTSRIFFLKTQAGWRETIHTENKHDLSDPMIDLMRHVDGHGKRIGDG